MISKLADWVILFIDYYDMKPEELIFKLLTIQITDSHRYREESQSQLVR